MDSPIFCSREVFYLINSLASSWFRWNTSWPEKQHFIKMSFFIITIKVTGIEITITSNLDKVVPGLGSGMRGNAIQRHLVSDQDRVFQIRNINICRSGNLQKLERQASVFATLKSESPWLAGRLPGCQIHENKRWW